ncbi:P-loop NTPase fold protein [Fretibacter rubidus]|uniref:P-loop NTPase fold protein n=1 Tax=Fretibacter rubidus TaxID=570162 RepID=UPI00352B81DB
MSALKEYLDYYKSLSSPGYAVLVTGAWGVGKTHQVKKALRTDEIYYVSLFGLESREEIEAAVLTAANPALNKKKHGLRWGTEKAKQVGGLYSLIGIVPSAINSLLKIELDPEKVIVFDDLERCSLKMKTLLGVINWFVEHQGSKVIIIAHDEKLGKKLQNQKEKLFGHTILVEPELVTAFFVFLKEIESSSFMTSEQAESASKFLRRNRQLIFSIFERQVVEDDQASVRVYGNNSLRVLRRSLFDVARLYSIIGPNFLSNEDAVSRLITEFCIFNLEHKIGSLPTKSLTEDWGDEMNLRMERRITPENEINIPSSPLERLENKYSQINLDKLLLNQSILSQTIVHGNYGANLLSDRLDSTTYFAAPAVLPAWRRFMSFDDLDDEIVEQAKNELLDQFENRELHEVGAMLHMFALRFMMSENAIITEDYPTVEQSCREYIDDLLSNGELPPRPTDWRWPESSRFRSSHGYSYWVREAYQENFSNVHQYLNDKRIEAFDNQGTDVAQEILAALRTNPDEFTKLISFRQGEGKYALLPVMHNINLNELVETWLSLPKESWRTIQYAFNDRYEGGRLQNDDNHIGELSGERDWAIGLRQSLEARAAALGGYKGLRISRIIPRLPQVE